MTGALPPPDPGAQLAPGPGWSHTNGSPLCPVPANGGKQPRPRRARARLASHHWKTLAEPATDPHDPADTVTTLAALTEILIAEDFTPDEEATCPAITADHGPLRASSSTPTPVSPSTSTALGALRRVVLTHSRTCTPNSPPGWTRHWPKRSGC